MIETEQDLNSQIFATDYSARHDYYNNMLVSFYETKIAKQCARFDVAMPHRLEFVCLKTDKFLLTTESNYATMGRNFTDTHFVQDRYYNAGKYIYEHPKENKEDIRDHLHSSHRCVPKAFALQFVVEAIETDNADTFNKCINKINQIPWEEAISLNKFDQKLALWDNKRNPNWEWEVNENEKWVNL